MRRRILGAGLAACLLALGPAAIRASAAGVTGSLRNYALVTRQDGVTTQELLSLVRIRIRSDASADTSAEAAYELVPRLVGTNGNAAGPLPAAALGDYRAYDLRERLEPQEPPAGSGFELDQNLDRFLVVHRATGYDLTVGRQPISFGTARVVNPTDVLAPFSFTTIATEELRGVDAVRFKKPFGSLGELDMGLVCGRRCEAGQSAAFARMRTEAWQTDVSVMAMEFRENDLVGVSLARSIGGAGGWFEAAEVLPQDPNDGSYARVSVGADYTFVSSLSGFVEYHYNGAGAKGPAGYLANATRTAYTEGAVYLLGRNYLAPGLRYELTPLVTLRGQALVNLGDGSVLASGTVEYNASENLYAHLGAYRSIGGQSPGGAPPRNEFGLYPELTYLALNWYF